MPKHKEDVTIRLGREIARNRKEKTGLSQVDFSERIEMARSFYCEVETGKRNISIRNLERIADGLGMSLAELLQNV